MQKVRVSPTRNKIHSNVQIQYKYHKEKTCDFIHKCRIFYNPLRIWAWHCKLRCLSINSMGISLIQKHGVLHFSNIVYLLCTPLGKSDIVYIGPVSTLPTIRLLGRVTNAGFSCIRTSNCYRTYTNWYKDSQNFF